MGPTRINMSPSAILILIHCEKRRIKLLVFYLLSLSGCPRARKSGIKITHSKEDKEDQEPIRYAHLRHTKPVNPQKGSSNAQGLNQIYLLFIRLIWQSIQYKDLTAVVRVSAGDYGGGGGIKSSLSSAWPHHLWHF